MNSVLIALVAVLTLVVVALLVVVLRQGGTSATRTASDTGQLTSQDIAQAVKDQVAVAMTTLNDQIGRAHV